MEKEGISQKDYESILRKHLGILDVGIKMPVRDKKALALVYTPGVAASCTRIQKDPRDAYKFTNKMNSMLVVTDSSAWLETESKSDWTNYATIPYLEAFSVYYKSAANIDCYPLVFDLATIANGDDLVETVEAIMPAFSAIEFFNVSKDRMETFLKKVQGNNKYAYLFSNQKKQLSEQLGFNSNLVYAGVLRAALDSQAYMDLDQVVSAVVAELSKQKSQEGSKSEYRQLTLLQTIIGFALDSILGKKLGGNVESDLNIDGAEFSKEYVLEKFRRFQIEGESAWVNTYPAGDKCAKKSNDENSLLLHARYRGVVRAGSKLDLKCAKLRDELFSWDNIDYISGLIRKNPEEVHQLTCKANFGSVITNGTAVLGLGDIGTLGGLPVMEGKSALFKLYGGSDIIPLCINETDPEKFVRICHRITPIFSAINLEDIKSPECFIIEPKLNSLTDCPVFHDDQHGTAIVVLAGMINALKIVKKNIKDIKIVVNGAGASGVAVSSLMIDYGASNIIVCDTQGAIYKGREDKKMNEVKAKIAEISNPNQEKGKLVEIIKGADVFVGLSAPKSLTKEMVQSMNQDAIIFALANPEPEIFPEEAKSGGARVVATGRSDFPNQVNNSLAFPGIFRAAIDVRAKNITIEMQLAAAEGIAKLVNEHRLNPDYVIPDSLDTDVAIEVTKAVARVAIKNGEARSKQVTICDVESNILGWFLEGELRNFDYIKTVNHKANF